MPRSWFTIGFLLSFLAVTGALQWCPPSPSQFCGDIGGVVGLRWAEQQSQYPKEVWIVLGLFGALAVLLETVAQLHQYTSILVRRGLGALFFCFTLGTAFAFLRMAQTTHIPTQESVETHALGGQVTLHGVIIDEPDHRPLQTKYTVKVSSLDMALDKLGPTRDDMWIPVTGKVLVTDYAAWPRHEYGDEVLVHGILERPEPFEDFPYDRYLSRYGIYAIMPAASVETVSRGHPSTRPFGPRSGSSAAPWSRMLGGQSAFTILYSLKERFERQIAKLLPEPHASFLSGLLTGSRRGIPKNLLEDFKSTGLTHIIAISGYNITIVISVISALLFFLPLRWRLLPSLLAIVFFTLFVGASPSVVRAAIMGGVGLLALHAGRQKHALIAILLAASLMTAWNPKILWYDAGFQLSFLSVLGLTYLSSFLERISTVVPDVFGMRDAFKMTIAAQLAATPLVIVLFGTFSIVTPLTNVLVAFLVPAAMLFGFLGVGLSFLSFSLGQFFAYIGWGALELIIRIAHSFADLPYTFLALPKVHAWWVVGYYLLLVSILALPGIHKNSWSFLARR